MPTRKTLSSIFVIEEEFKMYPKRGAIIFLEVNYATKSFSIRPGDKTDFVFKAGNEDSHAMWQAVGRCIAEAARIADEELWHPAPKQG